MLVVYVGPHRAVFAEGLEFIKGEPVLVSNTAGKHLLTSPLFELYTPGEAAPAAPVETSTDTEVETVTDKPLSFLNRKNT